jgi:hypothetical protein
VCANRHSALIFLLFAAALLYAEDTETESASASGMGLTLPPLSLFYRAALDENVRFSPDWKPTIPPDAFSVLHGGGYSEITLTIDEAEYRLSKNPDGSLNTFPFFYNGAVYTVEVLFDTGNTISGFTITIHDSNTNDDDDDEHESEHEDDNTEGNAGGIAAVTPSGDTTAEGDSDKRIEVAFGQSRAEPSDLLGSNPSPQIVRIHEDDAYYFVSFAYSNNEIIETYFSEDGALLFLYRIHFSSDEHSNYISIEKRSSEESNVTLIYYDSRGDITKMILPDTEYDALYNHNGVRYWEKQSANTDDTKYGEKNIQYDERHIPVRETISSAEGTVYIDYQYQFDAQGNWIERQAAYKKEMLGVLITVDESIIKRTIIYPP